MPTSLYKSFSIFLGVIFVVIFLVVLVSYGFYPVAWVSGEMLTARRFNNNYGAATLYYHNLAQGYGAEVSSSTPLTPTEIQASVLDQLIENKLIERGIREEIGADAEALALSRVEKFDRSRSIEAAVHTFYGWKFDEFEREILVPKAKQEILSGRLFLKGRKFEDWLAEEKRSKRVMIFSGIFYWDGEGVRIHDQE